MQLIVGMLMLIFGGLFVFATDKVKKYNQSVQPYLKNFYERKEWEIFIKFIGVIMLVAGIVSILASI